MQIFDFSVSPNLSYSPEKRFNGHKGKKLLRKGVLGYCKRFLGGL